MEFTQVIQERTATRKFSDKPIAQETLNNIKKDLQGETLSFIKIAEKYNTSSDMISKINKGVKQKQEDWEYPLRKNYLTPGLKKS